MLNEPTMEKLKELRLEGMRTAWEEQRKNPKTNELAFDERFGILVDAECLHRENKRVKRVLREAKLKLSHACVEGVDYAANRKIDKAVVRQLATCRWVAEHQQIIITGATGTGKTYFGCAFAQQACRKGYRSLYRRVTRLFHELRLAHADGTYTRLLARFARMDVLVLDDFGVGSLSQQDTQDLLEILDDRTGNLSTIITSQLDPNDWHAYLGEPTIADAICDRVLQGAHRIALKGPSRRPETKTEE